MLKKEIKNKLKEIGYTGKTDLESLLGVLPFQIKTEGQYVYFEMKEVIIQDVHASFFLVVSQK